MGSMKKEFVNFCSDLIEEFGLILVLEFCLPKKDCYEQKIIEFVSDYIFYQFSMQLFMMYLFDLTLSLFLQDMVLIILQDSFTLDSWASKSLS